jgi:hypothetical protein
MTMYGNYFVPECNTGKNQNRRYPFGVITAAVSLLLAFFVALQIGSAKVS